MEDIYFYGRIYSEVLMIIKGKEVSEKIRQKFIYEKKKNNFKLAILRVGKRPEDLSYEKGLISNCKKTGLEYEVFAYQDTISTEELKRELERVNEDSTITGAILFRPLPEHIDVDVRNYLDPNKDLDCMTSSNLANILEFREGLYPATALATLEFLKHYKIELVGKSVVIINSSLVLGRPLSLMLMKEKATVTICNSKTENLSKYTKNADVVISAIGKAKIHNKNIFRSDACLIDIGISEDQNGELSGDFDIDLLKDKVKYISPAIGGVASVTSAVLVSQLAKAKKLQDEEKRI